MGKMVHVAKRYTIEYGDTTAFNWKDSEFISVLDALGCSICRYENEDASAIEFECPADDYNDAVQNLEVYISDPHLFKESDDIKNSLEALGMTADDLLKTMKNFQQEADTSDGYLHFASF